MTETQAGEIARMSGALRDSAGRALKGLGDEIEAIFAAWLAGGHVLLEGPPGTGKTLLARAFSKCLGLGHSRVQFTPDLTATDILGCTVYDRVSGAFRFERGPVFTDVLVADEINRAPPRTQAALLEAMQERRVSLSGQTYELGASFFVMATQNPVEMEGTYPLPEAQLDRFAMKVGIGYPDEGAELSMLADVSGGTRTDVLDLSRVDLVVEPEALARMREAVRTVTADAAILAYVAALARSTRTAYGVDLGCSPRAAAVLLSVSRAMAAISGRTYVVPDDVKAMARRVLAHRIVVSASAEIEGMDGAAVLEGILERTEVPR